jgi:hypothetical protein
MFSRDMWLIDSGATVCITNLSQGFLCARTKKIERSLKVANGHEAKVEAVRSLPLVLQDSFTLILNNVHYVPSLQRNLIFVSLLENDGFECLFGNKKFTINLIIKLWVLLLGKTCCTCCS